LNYKTQILILLITCLFACKNSSNETELFYNEKQFGYSDLRYGYNSSNKWIKTPSNLKKVHETLKMIGYHKIIDKIKSDDLMFSLLDINRNVIHVIDSLDLSYYNQDSFPSYYQQFWTRRKREKNDEVVFEIINEIKRILQGEQIEVKVKYIDESLYNLLDFELSITEVNQVDANSFLNYLYEIGMHNSAYNLYSGENHQLDEIKWDNEVKENIQRLKKSEVNQQAWFADNTK